MRRFRFRACGNYKISYEEELNIFETDFGRFYLIAGLVIVFAVIPFIGSPYFLYIINTMGIYAIAAVGLNLLIGYTGQISLGHGAFFGVGAYAAAILSTRMSFPFWLSLPSAGLMAAAARRRLISKRPSGIFGAIIEIGGLNILLSIINNPLNGCK